MNRTCDGTSRRNVIKAGVLGGLGLSLADRLRLQARGSLNATGGGKNAIFIYLNGGQSYFESWDPKPDAGEVTGEFQPIRTSLPGLEVCEHMPKLAAQADKYCVLRGIKNAIGAHRPARRRHRAPFCVTGSGSSDSKLAFETTTENFADLGPIFDD